MWMQKFYKFAQLKSTFSILHFHLSKTLISVYLLYTLFSLNNHVIFFFLLFQQISQIHFLSFLFWTLFSLSLSFSHTVNFLSFSSFSHLSSPVKFSSFAHFFIGKLHKQTKNLHFNTNACQSKVHLGWIWWWQQGRCGGNSSSKVDLTANLTDFCWVFHVGFYWIFLMGFLLDLVFIDFGLD